MPNNIAAFERKLESPATTEANFDLSHLEAAPLKSFEGRVEWTASVLGRGLMDPFTKFPAIEGFCIQ